MDWIMIGAIAVGGWVMLSVLSSARISSAQRIAITMANAAVEKAKAAENEIPIARSSGGSSPIGSINGKERKAA